MFEISIIIICLAINSLLSAIEMAIMTVSTGKLKAQAQVGDQKAKRVLELKSNPERVLSVLQIGITLVGAISAAVGGAGAEENLTPFFQQTFALGEESAELLAIITVVLPLTYFSVVLGELVPKTFALKFPLKISKLGAAPLGIMDKLFGPVVFVLEGSTKFLCNLLPSRAKSERSTDQLSSIEIDGLTEIHKEYMLNLLSIDKRKVHEIIVPWNDVIHLDLNSDKSAVLSLVKQSGHTRLPVIDGKSIVGILHSKEFIAADDQGRTNWNKLVRPIQSFQENEYVLNALKALQSKRSHMGLILKNNEPVGIVTIEDILEEIVGEIYDEDDNPRVLMSLTAQMRSKNLVKN